MVRLFIDSIPMNMHIFHGICLHENYMLLGMQNFNRITNRFDGTNSNIKEILNQLFSNYGHVENITILKNVFVLFIIHIRWHGLKWIPLNQQQML